MTFLRKLPTVVAGAGLMLATIGTEGNGQETPSAKENEPKPVASDKSDPMVEKEIADAITNLGNLRVSTRELYEQFEKLGAKAIKPLVKAIEENQGLTQSRGIQALGRMTASEDEASAKEARTALESLVKSNQLNVSVQAQTMLKLETAFRREALFRKQAGQAGAGVGQNDQLSVAGSNDGKQYRIQRLADGSFKGTVTETDKNGPKTTEIDAKSEQEFQTKFPDAHLFFQQQIKRRDEQAAKLKENLAKLDALRAQAQNNPGNAPLQIPFNGQNRSSRRISITNGSRKIEVVEGTTKIEIQDENNGKNIKLKHTRDVDGKPKTDEYEAADLDELTKKHPEAAELYKKKIDEVKFPVLPGFPRGGQQNQIQIQINGGVPAVPFDPVNRNRPVATLAPEPRTIQVGTADGSIEITDKAGRDIKIKVTTTAQGESGVKEYDAEDLPTLAQKHPEIAKLYQKYTGAVLK